MTYSKSVSIFTISTVHIIAFVIIVAFNTYIYLRASKNSKLYSFLVVQSCFALWILAKIFKTVSPTFELRWFFVVLQYLGICVLEVAFLQFAFIYSKGRGIKKKPLIGLCLMATIQFVFIATNQYHHLFYSEFDFWGDEFAPLFYLFMSVEYLCFVIGIIMMSIRFRKEYKDTKTFLLMSAGIILPLLANIYYMSGYYHKLMRMLSWRSFDITPIAFEISLGFFAYAIYHRDFLNLKPIFDDEIIKHSSTGVIMFDRRMNMLECNQRGQELYECMTEVEISEVEGYSLGSNRTQSFKPAFNQDLSVLLMAETFDSVVELRRVESIEESHLFLHIVKREIKNSRDKLVGYLITMSDVTHFMELKDNIEQQMDELEAMNDELEQKIAMTETISQISARNFVARELHDILGHSMTLAIKLLEIGLLESEDSTGLSKVYNKLNEAYITCNKGYHDLRNSLQKNQELTYDLIGLKTEIKKMGRLLTVAGIEFNLHMTKENGLLTEIEYNAIKRFCQESITNAVKHGKPTSVQIHMDFNSKMNKVQVIDDGLGCQVIHKGNGLKGMEDRVHDIDGLVNYSSEEGKGFSISLSYP